jgi:hypothetical protein
MHTAPLFLRAFVIVSMVCLSAPHAVVADDTQRVSVSAGEFDRTDTMVPFQLPESARNFNSLKDAEGNLLPLQVEPNGRSVYVEPRLKKGTRRIYTLAVARRGPSADALRADQSADGVVKFFAGQSPILNYQAKPGAFPRPDIKPAFRRGGYLHPVFSPSGRTVTDDFPPNHIHHHGIWFPWTKTEFEGCQPDFWNMGDGKGTVEFVALNKTWSGEVHAGFQSQHQFVDLTAPTSKTALNETWEIAIFNASLGAKRFWMFDLVSTQICASSSPLKLPKYHYGGLGFRGNWQWNGKDKTFYLTSEGETDRVKGNETQGRWCHISGAVDGQLTGIAILCHPDNFRAPQPMRLHPSEPFFCFAPSQLGDWEIAPGKPYVSRYRFIVADGPPDKAELERLWNDYAHPPTVKIE